MIYIKKYLEYGVEFVSAENTIANLYPDFEQNKRAQNLYQFAVMLDQYLNYFSLNSSTAFGNPDYMRYKGQVEGYCLAKGWIWHEKDGLVVIKSGNRTVMKIERPKLSHREKENRKEINELMNDFGL